MAQHGYLREYDEGWDRGDDRGDWRERGERDWRERDRDWNERRFGDRDRGDRDFMFQGRERGEDRGLFARMGDRAREMFRDDDDRDYRGDRSAWEGNRDWPQRHRESGGMSRYGREHGFGGFQGDYGRSGREQGGFGGRGDYEQGRGSYSANPDDHYRSWRDQQVQSLDRDYQDYCREREQQFHQDFDSWRRNRQSGQAGTQGGQGALNLTASDRIGTTGGTKTDAPQEPQATVDTDSAATLGQGTEKTGRGRR